MIGVRAAILAMLVASPALAQAPSVEVREIFSAAKTAAGQPIELPKTDAEVVVSTYTIPPGAKLAVHRHPFPRYAYVMEGSIDVTDTDSGRVDHYDTGDFIVEMIGRWHFGQNTGTTPVRLLVIDQVEAGTRNTVLQPPQ